MKASLILAASLFAVSSGRTAYPGVTFVPQEVEAVQTSMDQEEAETMKYLKEQHKQFLQVGWVDFNDGQANDEAMVDKIGSEKFFKTTEEKEVVPIEK